MCITLEFGASMFDMNGLEFGYVFYLNEEMCVCVCVCMPLVLLFGCETGGNIKDAMLHEYQKK